MSYIGNSPVNGAFKKLDPLVFNGVQTTFTGRVAGTAVVLGTAQNVLLSIAGVVQEPQVAYQVSGSSIIFSEAPLAADQFFGVLLGTVGQVNAVTDASITSSKLATGAVTADKLAPGTVVTSLNGAAGAVTGIATTADLTAERDLSTTINNKTLGTGTVFAPSVLAQLHATALLF